MGQAVREGESAEESTGLPGRMARGGHDKKGNPQQVPYAMKAWNAPPQWQEAADSALQARVA
ncbi:hypothetical protein AD947_14930 [Acetobacter tropicalis]|uniref:Uncharacterized protein n=2 Tax=Acetobacter tropicalis TaxID=104102 RepID=A0A149TQ10_9PROT|nr:hypothetical protein AD947_14930 [Acetobacter tropicalis]